MVSTGIYYQVFGIPAPRYAPRQAGGQIDFFDFFYSPFFCQAIFCFCFGPFIFFVFFILSFLFLFFLAHFCFFFWPGPVPSKDGRMDAGSGLRPAPHLDSFVRERRPPGGGRLHERTLLPRSYSGFLSTPEASDFFSTGRISVFGLMKP